MILTIKSIVNLNKGFIAQRVFRNVSSFTILGIETSCDDTGCAIVSNEGKVLGESVRSQQDFHLQLGGILPPVARDLHEKHISEVIQEALSSSQLNLEDVDAIATTVKPGLPLSLTVGLNHGRKLAKIGKKPFIPIHHMEAHALTVRMIEKDVQFPFLVLLISGANSLISVAQSVDQHLLLGTTLDSAPGEIFDKCARRLKLRNIPEYKNMNGGKAIEEISQKGNPREFEFTLPLTHQRDCDFSFSGFKTKFNKYIIQKELKHDTPPDGVIPEAADLCASFQLAISKHLCQRLQRAMYFVGQKNLLPESKTLVVSGGVACNKYFQSKLNALCQNMGYKMYVPPTNLCTDNGVMVAWNGVERFQENCGVYKFDEIDAITVDPKASFGLDWRSHVVEADIVCDAKNRIKIEKL